MTKLLFTGVATGVALSCAFVLATSLPTRNIGAPHPTTTQSAVTAKADRIAGRAPTQQVVRDQKSDALSLTLAILSGKDIVSDEPVPLSTDTVAARDTTRADDVQPATPPATAKAEEAAAVVPARPRRVTAIVTPGGPLNIIPIPEPVENRPVAAPETATNFAAGPFGETHTLR